MGGDLSFRAMIDDNSLDARERTVSSVFGHGSRRRLARCRSPRTMRRRHTLRHLVGGRLCAASLDGCRSRRPAVRLDLLVSGQVSDDAPV